MTATGLIPRSGSNSNIASLSVQNGLRSQPIPSVGCKKRVSPTTEPGTLARFHRMITGRRVGMLLAVFVSLFSFLMLISFASQISVHFIAPAGLDVIHTWRIEVDKQTRMKEVRKGMIVGVEEISLRGGEKESVSGLVGIQKVLDDVKSGLKKTSERRLEGEKDSIHAGVESEAKAILNATMAARSLSEGLSSKAPMVPEVKPPNFEKKTNPPNFENHNSLPSLLTSDQPLPPGHPCHGFMLPPPPTDKKRTGPRPCPVCYLPVEEAMNQMPPASTLTSVVKSLTYIVEPSNNFTQEGLPGSEFGSHPSLEERNNSYQIQEHMNVHCGFVRGPKPGLKTGFEIDEEDLANMEKCMGIVVASAIFGNYDLLQQPKNISSYSRKNVCFFMFVDEETHHALSEVISDSDSEKQIWRIVVVHSMPYEDARRNGKIPKLLLHRLFPNARFSLWIDGKLQLVVDPYQVLERFLWRQNLTFAISQHYKRLDVFEEAEANKAAGKYNNASIDAQISFYKEEGIQHYDSSKSPFRSDVPEGCVIIREHTHISSLFTCLWFNEVDRFTSRDQLSFAIVRNKLLEKIPWRFNMFLDCERRNFVVQNYHKDILEQRTSLQRSYHQQVVEMNESVSMRVDALGSTHAALKESGRRLPSSVTAQQESRWPSLGTGLQESRRLSSSRKSRRHKRGAKV